VKTKSGFLQASLAGVAAAAVHCFRATLFGCSSQNAAVLHPSRCCLRSSLPWLEKNFLWIGRYQGGYRTVQRCSANVLQSRWRLRGRSESFSIEKREVEKKRAALHLLAQYVVFHQVWLQLHLHSIFRQRRGFRYLVFQ